ncbi:shikimate kinase [Nonlabens sp.]|uniref:shikimate kinase n=1 Tax=Nonlabens sp. TaxID=1888209 RepID=UPI0025D0C13B|nr:shikimate kinase [Nonlabens sp.]
MKMAFKIVLLGYMGSGKTTVGKELAKTLSVKFVDLDKEIERLENKSIPQIFKDHGDIYFRKKEKSALEDVLNSKNNMVLSLGGGTPCYYDSMNYLNNKDEVHSIYLDVSTANLVKRLGSEKSRRPMLSGINTEQELQHFLGKHLFERRPYYQQAKQTLKVGEESVEEQVNKIVALLF